MMKSLIKLARPKQWLKNGVVLAALIFSGAATDPDLLQTSLWAVGLFCLLSSAVYVMNDIVDRKKDRQHPLKMHRPIASGKVSVSTAGAFLAGLLVLGLAGAWLLNPMFFVAAVAFLTLNVAYSLWLKNIVILDVMSIAVSFSLRAYAGAFAIGVPASKWLLINTILLALFLGFGKRRHELVALEGNATKHRSSLGHYSPYLLDQLIGVVTASVVVAYMLYTFSPEVSEKLGTNNLFFTVPLVLYGIFRYLYLIHKEERGGSPTDILISDRPILIDVIVWLAAVVVVLYYAPGR
ncbi:MAG: decaprenyl-phosphate phosphoribosyltransferase [bacterium]